MHTAKQDIWRFVITLGRLKNKSSKGLRRRYKVRNFVPKFQDILYRSKHMKRQRNRRFQHGGHSHAPKRTDGGVLKFVLGSWLMKVGAWLLTRHTHAPYSWSKAPSTCFLRPNAFCDFLVKKARIFSQILGGKSPYKYRIPHSELNGSRRTQALRTLREESLSSLKVFLGYILFLL